MGKSKGRGTRKVGAYSSAESRWNLSKRNTPEAPSTPNEHLMQDMAVTYAMERAEIVEKLLLYPRNVDCISDDAQRREVCDWLRIPEPGEPQRVLFIKEQVAKSSSTGDVWAALLKNEKLVDRTGYHRLRYQRLDEQVGRCLTQEKYRRNKQMASGERSDSLVVRLDHIGNANIRRDHTGLTGFDLLGGQDRKNPRQIGWCVGDLILVGGQAGVGKTKLLLQALTIASGPIVNDTALYLQSEFDLEIFKSRYCDGLVQGDEDLYISSARSMDSIIEAMYQTKPRWVVIDSKDKVHECKTSAGWERFQNRMSQVAKDIKCTVFLVTHLNAGKDIFGGAKLKHDVDAVVILTKEDVSNFFRAAMPEKNRGGMANKDHFGIWYHVGAGVACLKQPPRWLDDKPVDLNNPLLVNPPESITEEEKLRTELDALLVKVRETSMEKMTDAEKERLGHITDWMTKRDTDQYQDKLKDIKRQRKEEEKKRKDEEKNKDKAQGFQATEEDEDDDDPNAGEGWKDIKPE